jgi:8-oxo-dGTP diphosphatase
MADDSARPTGSEQAFLEGYDASAFPRPSVTVDVAALSAHDGDLWATMVQRREHPFRGAWALPGGFVRLDESLNQAAQRVLADEAGLENVFLEQLYTFGEPERDPRTRVITVGYYALVDWRRLEPLQSGEQPALLRLAVEWSGETGGPVQVLDADGRSLPPAFDHADILGMAVKRIRGKLDYVPIGFQLLPARFSLRQLQEVHETVLSRPLNKDSFRRRMLDSGYLEATGEHEQDVDHRPAELYRFARRSAV